MRPALLALALVACSDAPAPSDGGTPPGMAVLRTATTRSVYGTAVNSLLLDPFASADTARGHFTGTISSGALVENWAFGRALVSQSPAGVSTPVAVFPAPSDLSTGVTDASVVAPFPGGTQALVADIWVSVGTTPPPDSLVVAIVPLEQPNGAVPFAPTGDPVTLGGRLWQKLALPSPLQLAQGGWFVIEDNDPTVSFWAQAPEVTPATASSPLPPPRRRASSATTQKAIARYIKPRH